MSNTGIPYLTKSWNFYTGCLHTKEQCPVADECWAKGNYHRFKRDYTPKLHPEKLLEPIKWRKPQRAGVCFTGDLFGEWFDPNERVYLEWAEGKDYYTLQDNVKTIVEMCPQHQFFFLTKNPAGYRKWGQFPDNAWLGATVCNEQMFHININQLSRVEARKKWLSIEPLINWDLGINYTVWLRNISWVVIGGWSTVAQRKRHPIEISWIKEIVTACDKAGIPVFLKDNLYNLMLANYHLTSEWGWREMKLRQELPELGK